MRRRLLLILLVTLAACLGSECSGSGSGSGNSVAAASAGSHVAGTGGETGFVAPVPEPSAALVFGVGLLIAGAVSRRKS